MSASISLEAASYVLNKYYLAYDWSAAGTITDADAEFDEFGNIINGLRWGSSNDIPKPTVAQLQEKYNSIVSEGEVRQKFAKLDGPESIYGDMHGFYGTVKEYASLLLRQSDFAALPDVGLANQSEWDAYRASLRAIRSNPTENPTWPSKPAVTYS